MLLVTSPTRVLPQSQMTTGVIEGTVYDEQGAVVPNARVEFKHLGIGISRRVRSDHTGRYIGILLPIGNYEITARQDGFGTTKRIGIRLTVGQTQRVDLPLKVAPTETRIEVTDAEPLLEFRSEQSTLIDGIALSGLPLNGRRFLDLALLAPIVYQEKERGQLSLSGARGINSSISIDGANFYQPFFGGQRGGERSPFAYVVSQEAVQEFRVVHGNFPAEFGGSAGGLVNVVTKSGSSEYHGSSFYYLRHKEFAVKDFVGSDRAPTRQQFGFSLGGPVVQGKTFFYTIYDQQAENQPLTVRFSSASGLPQDIVNKQGTFRSTNDINTYLFKLDSQLTPAHTLSARYNYSRNLAENGTQVGVTGSALENNGTERNQIHGVVSSLNSVLGQKAFNEFRWQWTHEARPRINNGEDSDFVSKAGPEVRIGNCCTLGGLSPLPALTRDQQWQVSDNLSVLRGSHHFKFGLESSETLVDQTFRGNWRGLFFFNTIESYLRALRRETNPVTGQPYSADLFRVYFGDGRFNASVWQHAGFVQDTFRVSPRLIVNVGLRYEASLLPQPPEPNLLLPQTARIPSEKEMWQPRFGLSWDLFGDGKTSLRLGGGIFYARTPLLLLNQAFTSNGSPNVGVTLNLLSPQIDAVQRFRPEFVFPFVPDTSRAANASYFLGTQVTSIRPDASFFAPDFRNPRSLQYTAGLERMVRHNLTASLDYLHVNSVYLERIRDVNLPDPVVQLDNSLPPMLRPRFDLAARPNRNFGILRQQESTARANYDAITITMRSAGMNKLHFLSHYTLAYNRDDDSNERNFLGISYENAFDLRSEYGWSRNDIRHRAVFSGMYDFPWGLQLGSIIEWRTNFPFTAFTGVDSNGDGQLTDRPIINGIPLRRNSIRHPNSFNHDLRLSKTLRIRETHQISLILDMFNLWNRSNFLFASSINEQGSSIFLGSLWGRSQTPLPTFRNVRLADGSINKNGLISSFPFQFQVAVKYSF